MPTRAQALLARLLGWLRRNPEARADALELAAARARARADDLASRGRIDASHRALARATVLDVRAAQLRREIR